MFFDIRESGRGLSSEERPGSAMQEHLHQRCWSVPVPPRCRCDLVVHGEGAYDLVDVVGDQEISAVAEQACLLIPPRSPLESARMYFMQNTSC